MNISKHSLVTISQADSRPMYLQVKEQIRHRIAVGELKAGDDLPSIRQLAADISVSVITIKRAYLELELEGVIQTRPGRGSCVAESPSLGQSLKEEELQQHLAAAAGLAALLHLTEEELIERLRRLLRGNTEGAA